MDDILGSLLVVVKKGRSRRGNPWVAVVVSWAFLQVNFNVILLSSELFLDQLCAPIDKLEQSVSGGELCFRIIFLFHESIFPLCEHFQ